MPAIEWKPVRGFEGLYEVSSGGGVKSLPRTTLRVRQGYTQVLPVRECLLKPYSVKHYQYVILRKDKVGVKKSVHRLVAEAFIENAGCKPQVNHINSDPSDNTICNLEWVTASENQAHAVEKGLRPTGEKSGLSKLSNIESDFVKLWAGLGYKQGLIAGLFHIHQSQVSKIFNNKQRQHQYKELQHGCN